MAKLWPLASSTVVSARRVVSEGTLMLSMTMAPLVESWLTSGSTCRLMRSSAAIVATKLRLTPNFFQSMPTRPVPAGTGTGNSPPARKLAGSPETRGEVGLGEHGDEAVIVERVDERVELEVACVDAAEQVVDRAPAARARLQVLKLPAKLVTPMVPTPVVELSMVGCAKTRRAVGARLQVGRDRGADSTADRSTRPNAKMPLLKTFSQLMPNCLTMSRDISATRTRRLIWLGASTFILLMSCFGSLTKRAAMRLDVVAVGGRIDRAGQHERIATAFTAMALRGTRSWIACSTCAAS